MEKTLQRLSLCCLLLGASLLPTAGEPVNTVCGAPAYDYWLYLPCSSDADCVGRAGDSQCFQGSCVCRPGFFFAYGDRCCKETCDNLSSNVTMGRKQFVQYTSAVFSTTSGYYDHVTSGDWYLGSCNEVCLNDDRCLTMAVVKEADQLWHCYLYDVLPSDPSASLSTGVGPDHAVLQRQCHRTSCLPLGRQSGWYYDDCDMDHDCELMFQNTECRSYRCRCKPGFVQSSSGCCLPA